jgi:hypothetical protein
VEDLIQELARGNVTEVKVVVASIAFALAIYQLVLAAFAYGKVRWRGLGAGVASWVHRASGDVILVLVVLVAVACVSVYGFEDGGAHAVFGIAVLVVLAAKVVAVRSGHRFGRALPYLGMTLFALLAAAWATSAGDFLG